MPSALFVVRPEGPKDSNGGCLRHGRGSPIGIPTGPVWSMGLWLLGKDHILLTKNQTNRHDLKPQTQFLSIYKDFVYLLINE